MKIENVAFKLFKKINTIIVYYFVIIVRYITIYDKIT